MSEDKRCNGWRNYETWLFKLWLDNEEPLYLEWRERTRATWEDAEPTTYWTRRQSATFKLADELKDFAEENTPDLGACVWSDLLASALAEIDWQEIAENMLSEHFETDEDGHRVSDSPATA